MISLESIKKTYPRVPEGGVYQLVYPWNKEWIFRTSFIEISEVHTNLALPILLFYYHNVSQPFWIENFVYCPSLFQLVDFSFTALEYLSEDLRGGCFFGRASGFTFS